MKITYKINLKFPRCSRKFACILAYCSPANPANPAPLIPLHAGLENDARLFNIDILIHRDWSYFDFYIPSKNSRHTNLLLLKYSIGTAFAT